MEVRKIKHTGKRVETGIVKFGDDWNGYFIRGDNAFYYANTIRTVLSNIEDSGVLSHEVEKMILKGLSDALMQVAQK